MTTIDLHPEEMLDAARRGTLGPKAEADLRAHLSRCAACRLSLTLPEDLRAEAAPASGDAALLARMVRGAMAEEPRTVRVSSGLTLRRAAIGLALLFVGGSAGAGVWANRATLSRRFSPEIVALPRAEAPRALARSKPRPPVVEPVEERAPAPVVAPVRPTRRVPVAVAPALSAGELFADANRARRAGDDTLALRRYAELRKAYPGSREEITARVVAADLLLAEGSPREALAGFEGYLAASPDGTLSEEALVGRALSLQRLGRRGDEREAWTQLLRKYPESVQGARARGRLAELR